MGDFATLFRLVAASALVGLLAYCGGHILQVWKKRNARMGGADKAPPVRRLAWAALVAGLVLTPAAVALRELTHTEGVLTGEDLFVVRASDDMAVEWLAERDAVAAGEPLARFGSGPRSAKADELKARLARAQAERDVLAHQPLALDPELTRRHQGVAQERAQVEQEVGHAVAAAETADRDLAAQLRDKTEALARLERTLTEKKKDLDRANIRLAHARDLLAKFGTLIARGTVTAIEYADQQKAVRDGEVEVAALTQEVKDGQAEKAVVKTNVEKLEAGRADPAAPLRAQVASLRARLARLTTEEKDLKARLDADLARSTRLRAAETAQAEARVREQEAGVAGLAGEQEARAPFAGRIAYRATSPNAIRPKGPLLVLGPENGFRLTARLPKADAEALRDAGEAMIEVGEDGPERRVPARFHKAAALTHEPDHAALQLECQPPPEVVRRLADGEKLTVTFAWRPHLMAMWPFQAGLVLSAAGIVGLVLTRRPVPGRALIPWAGPTVGAPAVAAEARAAVHNGWSGPDVIPAVAGSHPRRRITDWVVPPDTSVPQSLEVLEAACDACLDRLNRAECPEEAARLLARLHHLRRALRDLDLPPAEVAADEEDAGPTVLRAGS